MPLISDSYTLYYGNAGLANAQVATATGDQAPYINVSFTGATTAQIQPLNLGANTATYNAIFIQTAGSSMTVNTNTTAGVDSITVNPGYPLVWVRGMPTACPISAGGITNGIYITQPSATTGTFTLRATIDPAGGA